MKEPLQLKIQVTSIGFKIALYALLLDIMYRSFMLGEASWDLMAIVIVSSGIAMIYQIKNKIFSNNLVKYILLIFSISAIVAFLIVAIVFLSKKIL